MQILALPHGAACPDDNAFRLLQTKRTVICASNAQNGIAGFVIPEYDPDYSPVNDILDHVSHVNDE